MTGNEASCQSGRSLDTVNTPRQLWPEEEAEPVGKFTSSLIVLGVTTSG